MFSRAVRFKNKIPDFPGDHNNETQIHEKLDIFFALMADFHIEEVAYDETKFAMAATLNKFYERKWIKLH